MRFQTPRGTKDILPEEQIYWHLIESTATKMAKSYGYSKIDTPIFEDTDLFSRSVGDSTDILEKETYTFVDRGGDSLTLRPEGTASVARAYVQNGMHNQPQPIKLYYIFQNFRYERPQAGRYRAFNQFGVEAFGESDHYIDSEIIELAWRFLIALGINDLVLSINSIGCIDCRPEYTSNLKSYYSNHRNSICNDCDRRVDKNPLRLLDCKNDPCQSIISDAPKSVKYLCKNCETHFIAIKTNLDLLHIPFYIDNCLVRGLDYYSKTVFEIAPPTSGRTSVIAGGGRYDGLIEQIGGSYTPGIGFAMGIERIIDNLKRLNIPIEKKDPKCILLAYMGEISNTHAIKIASLIRQSGGSAVLGPSRGLKSQMKYASSIDASYVVIIGDQEIEKGVYKIKNLSTSEQIEISIDKAVDYLLNIWDL